MSLTISIVTPSLNQGRFIERTICSVLSQEGDFHIEYIVMDGGSIDETLSILNKYKNLIDCKNWAVRCAGITFRYWSELDSGQSAAINKAFKLSSGKILAWLNSDDYYAPGTLKVICEYFSLYPEAGAFVGDGEMRDENDELVFYAQAFDANLESLSGWLNRYFYQPSCFISRDAWEKCGPLQEWLVYAMDIDLWLKIAQSFKIISINKLLSTSQKHDKAKTTAFWYLTAMEVAIVISSHGMGEAVRSDYADFLTSKEQERKQQIFSILNSRSWKIASMLRQLSILVKKLI